MQAKSGFTLIELLVVIAVIGLLASVILVAFNGARTKARTARLATDQHQITVQIENMRSIQNQTLLQITGNGCTDCSFTAGVAMKSQTALALATNVVSWQKIGFATAPTDPWGNP